MSTSNERAERELRAFARLQLRAGLTSDAEQLQEVTEAVAAEMPHTDAGIMARGWLAAARKELLAEQQHWPAQTDVDKLRAAFAECRSHGVELLAGVADHWAARALLDERGASLRGVLWFTQPDVWHAIDHGMLEVNLWHSTGANAAPGDVLLDGVLGCLQRHGLSAHFDEGRIEVAARWQRRI